jgi:hypothetical protein
MAVYDKISDWATKRKAAMDHLRNLRSQSHEEFFAVLKARCIMDATILQLAVSDAGDDEFTVVRDTFQLKVRRLQFGDISAQLFDESNLLHERTYSVEDVEGGLGYTQGDQHIHYENMPEALLSMLLDAKHAVPEAPSAPGESSSPR